MNNIKGLNNVLKNLKGAKEDIENCIYESIEDSMSIAKSEVKANAPVDKGYMRENIFSKVKKSDSKISGSVYGTTEYNTYVEFGTGPKGAGTYPYTINGYSLKYKGDKWRVNIPEVGVRWIAGQRAQPHFGKAFQKIDKILLDILKQRTKKYR